MLEVNGLEMLFLVKAIRLGPRMVCQALLPCNTSRPRVLTARHVDTVS